jgi:molecular chaperone GrpE
MTERNDDEIELGEEDLRDRLIRQMADNENQRKQGNRRIDEARRHAEDSIILAFAPVFDDLERAVEAARTAKGRGSLKKFREGLGLIRQRMQSVLRELEVEGFKTEGEAYAAARMEAIANLPTRDLPPGTVARELTAGFTRRGKLLRPAQVAVAIEPGDED